MTSPGPHLSHISKTKSSYGQRMRVITTQSLLTFGLSSPQKEEQLPNNWPRKRDSTWEGFLIGQLGSCAISKPIDAVR